MIKKIFNKIFKQKNGMSFRQGFDLTELPIVTLYQGNKRYNFLLDTGSNDSIIDSNILKQMEYKKTDGQSDLFGLGGSTTRVSICNITLSYKDREYNYDYLVNDMSAPFDRIKQSSGVILHGIIGSKFFNQFKYVLDFDELIAYSKE